MASLTHSWKVALSMSKEDLATATPTGTVALIRHDQRDDTDHIVKWPPPSSDPADPLNWPAWRKLAVLVFASVYAFAANVSSSILAPALSLWPMFFPRDQRTIPELSYLIAVNVLLLGASNIIWVPLSNWMGRRPVLILANLVFTFSTVWCAYAGSYESLLAARAFQGLGGGAADSVAPALVGDVYFVHERGRAMAFYTIFLSTGSLIGGTIGGYVVYQQGWMSLFWVTLGLCALSLVLVIFLVPETLYDRPPPALSLTTDAAVETKEGQDIQVKHVDLPRPEDYRPFTFARSLGFGGLRGNLWKTIMQPWISCALPGTWVATFHYAGLVGGVVTIALVGAQHMAQPPYLWGANAGLINIGGLIGAVLGYVYTHFVADARLTSRARRSNNRGFAEAEDRLPTLFPALAISTAGFLVFGFCAQNPGGNRWVGLQVGFGMLTFGLMQVPSVDFNYLLDSYGHLAADCFVVVTVLRSVISFTWTFFVQHWIEARGAAEVFGIFGMLMGIFSLLTIPLYVHGKRARVATTMYLGKQA